MKSSFFLVLFISMLTWSCTEEPLPEPIIPELSYLLPITNRSVTNTEVQATLYADGFLKIQSEDLELVLEKLAVAEFKLNIGTFNQAKYYVPIISTSDEHYLTNRFGHYGGSVTIENYDPVRREIVGKFDFSAGRRSEIGSYIDIKAGRFKNVKVMATTERYAKSKVALISDREEVTYIDYFMQEGDNHLVFIFKHPRKDRIRLQFPKNLSVGKTAMTSANIGERDKVFAFFSFRQDGDEYGSNSIDAQIEVEFIDISERRLKATITGTFQGVHNNFLQVEDFRIDLRW